MTLYDVIFISLICMMSFFGFFVGFVASFSKFFTLLIPLLITYIGLDIFQLYLEKEFDFYSGAGSELVVGIFIYILLYLFFKVLFVLTEALIKSINLGLINRVFGAILGFIAGSCIGYIFLIITSKIYGSESLLYFKIQSYLSFFLDI